MKIYYLCFLYFFASLFSINTQAAVLDTFNIVTINTFVQAKNRVGKKVLEAYKYGAGVNLGNGWIITAAHVVQSSDVIVVNFTNGKKKRAIKFGEDLRTDLVLLRLTSAAETTKWFSLANHQISFAKPILGEDIYTLGNPNNSGIHINKGAVSFVGFSDKNNYRIPIVKTDAQVKKGFSGGALLNISNQLVGIVTGMDDSYTYAIPGKIVQEVVNKLKKKEDYKVAISGY